MVCLGNVDTFIVDVSIIPLPLPAATDGRQDHA